MLFHRFEAWRIGSCRQGEFHRTTRCKPGAQLMVRFIGRETWGTPTVRCLSGAPRPTRQRFRRGNLVRCRLAARVGAPSGPYYSGPLRCVARFDLFEATEFGRGVMRYPRGRPLASIAAHRMQAFGYTALPF
jgi:hypothetical protein